MGALPRLRSKNSGSVASKNRIAGFSAVLPEV